MGNADTDPIVSTETWVLRFNDHPDIPVTVHGHQDDHGVWYYAHSAWPGLDYELHMSHVTAREAVERLVETGVRNGGNAAGLRGVLAPGEVTEVERLGKIGDLSVITLHAEVTRLRTALDDVAHAHERDLMRIARALGFTHEPPSNVDAMVAVAESLTAMRPAVDEALATVNETKASLGEAIAKVERLTAENSRLRTILDDVREHLVRTRLLSAETMDEDVPNVVRDLAMCDAEMHAAVEERRKALKEMRVERDTARRDLDAVCRVLAEGLATGEDDDLDALALAAKACETIDRLTARMRDLGRRGCEVTKTRALAALARGETTPSLDAIRAHNGFWFWTLSGDRTYGGGYVALTIADDGRVWGVGATPRTYSTPEEFAAWGAVRRWWRVAADGSLTVGEKVDAAPDVG